MTSVQLRQAHAEKSCQKVTESKKYICLQASLEQRTVRSPATGSSHIESMPGAEDAIETTWRTVLISMKRSTGQARHVKDPLHMTPSSSTRESGPAGTYDANQFPLALWPWDARSVPRLLTDALETVEELQLPSPSIPFRFHLASATPPRNLQVDRTSPGKLCLSQRLLFPGSASLLLPRLLVAPRRNKALGSGGSVCGYGMCSRLDGVRFFFFFILSRSPSPSLLDSPSLATYRISL